MTYSRMGALCVAKRSEYSQVQNILLAQTNEDRRQKLLRASAWMTTLAWGVAAVAGVLLLSDLYIYMN